MSLHNWFGHGEIEGYGSGRRDESRQTGAQRGGTNRLRRQGGRRHDGCSVESLEPRRFLSVNNGSSDALLLWQGSAPPGQLPPPPPAAVSGLPAAPNGLIVAPIGAGISAPSGVPVSSPGGLSPGGPGDQSLSGGGLLGGGPVTAPSGGGSSSGTSPTGTPSGAPYSGGGQPAGGQDGDVEDQLARTWAEWRKDWSDWFLGRDTTRQRDGGDELPAGSPTTSKLQAQRDLEKAQGDEAGGVDTNGKNIDKKWKTYREATEGRRN